MMMGSRKTVPPLRGCQRRNATVDRSDLQDVPDGSVGRKPHLLQLELLDTALVRSDGGALDANAILLDSLGRVDGDLVVGLVAVLETLRLSALPE